MNFAVHWPFLLTALVVLGFLVHDALRKPDVAAPPPPKRRKHEGGDLSISRHSLEDGEEDKVYAMDIIEREGDKGRPLHLNWSVEDTDPHGYALTRDRGEWPTAVIPIVKDDWF